MQGLGFRAKGWLGCFYQAEGRGWPFLVLEGQRSPRSLSLSGPQDPQNAISLLCHVEPSAQLRTVLDVLAPPSGPRDLCLGFMFSGGSAGRGTH